MAKRAMTPARRAALRKAQLASARKRKGKKRGSSMSANKKRTRRWARRGAVGYGGLNAIAAYGMTGSLHSAAISGATGALVGAAGGAGAAAIRNRMGKKKRRRR